MSGESPAIDQAETARAFTTSSPDDRISAVDHGSAHPNQRSLTASETAEIWGEDRRASTPRLGFLGVGWIGRRRMKAIAASGRAEIVGVADPSPDMRAYAGQLVSDAELLVSLDDLLAMEPDGVVIATPSALHAEHAIAALESGAAVFCQKPLGRTAVEADAIVRAARTADRYLAADFSYRFTEGVQRIRELVASGELGDLYAADLVFHNAYGPDKAWFHNPTLSGGGCVMDLGVHLIDLALWMFDFAEVRDVDAQLFAGGRPLGGQADRVEDFATAQLHLESGAVVRLACSWHLHAGCDAVIAASFYGTAGGAALRNLNGSFYDFTAERFHGTSRSVLSLPPDDWGGRAAVDWVDRLARGQRFDAAADRLIDVAAVLDTIYSR